VCACVRVYKSEWQCVCVKERVCSKHVSLAAKSDTKHKLEKNIV